MLTNANCKKSFILQQGLDAPENVDSESLIHEALQFQPRLIGALILIGVGSQSPQIFAVLGAILLCSAIVPRSNPFNALYNRTIGTRRGSFLLRSAPPRRCSEAIAGSLALSIGALLAFGHNWPALALEGVFVLANAAVVFSGFCFAALLFSWYQSAWSGLRHSFQEITCGYPKQQKGQQ